METEHVSFSPQEVAVGIGYPRAAALVPFDEGVLTAIGQDLFLATVKIRADEYCTNGVFSPCVAVDSDARRCKVRAVCEAIERYCLAAIGRHTLRETVPPLTELFRFPYTSIKPFLSSTEGASFLPITTKSDGKTSARYINAGDLFAPYPLNSGHCGMAPSTNGVAFGQEFQLAAMSALHELIERDHVMRFWYTSRHNLAARISPSECAAYAPIGLKFLRTLGYELRAFQLSKATTLSVVLVFARQEDLHFPYCVCAAAAGHDHRRAVESAVHELIQTLLALACTSGAIASWYANGRCLQHLQHHMFFYSLHELAAEPCQYVWDLWDNASEAFLSTIGDHTQSDIFRKCNGHRVYFADLTPPQMGDEAACVRAVSDTLWPLILGEEVAPVELISTGDRIPFPHPFP